MSKKEKSGNWLARHKILTVVLAFIAIAIIAGAAGGGSKSDTNTGDKAKTDNKTAMTTAKVGEAARDGQFEFIVKSVTCGKPSVTDSSGYVTKTAQGQYCLMDVTVKNIGDKQQYFSESDQKLLNSAGQQYSPDTTATLTNSNNSDALLAQINPGNTAQGVLVFDIPKDQTAVSAEMHDSSFSGGVKVNLQ
jgi:hypothetical protein